MVFKINSASNQEIFLDLQDQYHSILSSYSVEENSQRPRCFRLRDYDFHDYDFFLYRHFLIDLSLMIHRLFVEFDLGATEMAHPMIPTRLEIINIIPTGLGYIKMKKL